jgi:hypothetical protein
VAISNLNPVRLVSYGFKAPAPSVARPASVPEVGAVERIVKPATETALLQAEARPAELYRPIEPMLLLHQERVRTAQIVLEYVSRALQTLRTRATGA